MNRQFAEDLQVSINRWWNVNKNMVNLIYNKWNEHEQPDSKIFAYWLCKKKGGVVSDVEDAMKK